MERPVAYVAGAALVGSFVYVMWSSMKLSQKPKDENFSFFSTSSFNVSGPSVVESYRKVPGRFGIPKYECKTNDGSVYYTYSHPSLQTVNN
jgi:hypothetical protein